MQPRTPSRHRIHLVAALAVVLATPALSRADDSLPSGKLLLPGEPVGATLESLGELSWFGRRHAFQGTMAQRVRIEFRHEAYEYFDEITVVDSNGRELDIDQDDGGDAIEFFIPHHGLFSIHLESEDEMEYVVTLTVLPTPKMATLGVGRAQKVALEARKPVLLQVDVPPAFRGKHLRFEVTGKDVSARLQSNPNGGDIECVLVACMGTDFTWPDATATAYLRLDAKQSGEATVRVTEGSAMEPYYPEAKELLPGVKVGDTFTATTAAAPDPQVRTFFFRVAEGKDFALRLTSTGTPPRAQLMESKKDTRQIPLELARLDGETRLGVKTGTWFVFVEAAGKAASSFTLELVPRPRLVDQLALFGGPAETPVGNRVGRIAFSRAYKETNEAKAAQASLQAVFTAYQELIDEKRDALASLKGAALEKAQKEAVAFYEDLQAKIEAKERDAIDKLGTRMLSLAPTFKRAHGASLVVDADLTLWATPSADLTEALLRSLDAGAVTDARKLAAGRVAIVDSDVVFRRSKPAREAEKKLAAITDTAAREKVHSEESERLLAACNRLIGPIASREQVSIVLWKRSGDDPVAGIAWKVAPLDLTLALMAALDAERP